MDEFLGVLWSVSQSICSNSRVTISEATASIEGNDGVEKVYLAFRRQRERSKKARKAASPRAAAWLMFSARSSAFQSMSNISNRHAWSKVLVLVIPSLRGVVPGPSP